MKSGLLKVEMRRLFLSSFFLIQLKACCWGSMHSGYREAWRGEGKREKRERKMGGGGGGGGRGGDGRGGGDGVGGGGEGGGGV